MKKQSPIVKKSKHKSTAHSQRLVLESRLVFDGAIAATAVEVQPEVIDNKPIAEPTSEATPPPSEPTIDIAALEKPATVVDYQPNPDNTEHQPAFSPLATEHPFAATDLALSPVIGVGGEHATTLIIVDPRAENAANLLANPPAQTQVISLDATRDGFQQVSEILQGRHDVTELHVLAWTEGNSQWLGNKSLSSTLEPAVSNELTHWGDAFADNTTIVFHGTSNLGTSWLNHIDALTGADARWTQDAIDFRTHELIVVDTSIENYQSLLDTVNPSAEILYIDPSKDGINQIADALSGRTDISALHILSHGTQGSVTLGTATLNGDSIDNYKTQLAEIGHSLTNNGDILFYGCNVASGSVGIEFINHLADFTTADVAASDNLTGNVAKNGDWTLEQNTGTIETASLTAFDYAGTLGFGAISHNGADGVADPLRLITWNVIGLDSNKPLSSGPDTFMVGLRVEADAAGLTNLNVKIVEDNGVNIFGAGSILIGDNTIAADGSDGVDQIHLINKLTYTNESITPSGYKDFYFNVKVDRLNSAYDQIQPFHFEVFQDNGIGDGDLGDGIKNGSEVGVNLNKFSWLSDTAAANTPLYLYVEHYISQARNDVNNQTYDSGSDAIPAIRVDDNATPTIIYDYLNPSTNIYDPASPITIFVGQTLNIRSEGQTATQGYAQLTLSTVFDTNIFQIQKTNQYYNQPILDPTYQQDLGVGDTSQTFNADPFANDGTANTSIYANSAGWNPATHSLMITNAPPKAGGGPIITDYQVQVTGAGSGRLDTLILDYSGSSFHYNADLDTGIEGLDYVRFNAVHGAIVGNVSPTGANTPAVTMELYKYTDANANGKYDVGETMTFKTSTTTDTLTGNYVFKDLLPDHYLVKEVMNNVNYHDVSDTDGDFNGNGLNLVEVNLTTHPLLATAGDLGVAGLAGL
ncbi:MAG: DUF4347 domain-containing protein, partial [Methylococcaceae bacterium]|nr:DUF4347 domain-containing protein [Methylococcaceae bacterium]